MKIKLKDIQVNSDRQPRVGLTTDYVKDLKLAYEDGSKIPPVIVFSLGKQGPYFLADGFHRFEAARQSDFKDIECEIITGDERAAFKHALGCNSEHGLRRTNADKRRTVGLAFADKELSQYSDNRIAQLCAVSQDFVSNLRKSGNVQLKSDFNSNADSELETAKTSKGKPTGTINSDSEKRKGKDGKSYSPKKGKKEPIKEPETPKIPEKQFDETGFEISAKLLPHWIARKALFKTAYDLIHPLKLLLQKALEGRTPDRGYRELSKDDAGNARGLEHSVKHMDCHAVCTCEGENSKCEICKGEGILSKDTWNTFIPEDIRKRRERLKK